MVKDLLLIMFTAVLLENFIFYRFYTLTFSPGELRISTISKRDDQTSSPLAQAQREGGRCEPS